MHNVISIRTRRPMPTQREAIEDVLRAWDAMERMVRDVFPDASPAEQWDLVVESFVAWRRQGGE